MAGQLGVYLNDHFAGATGAVELIRRAERQYDDGLGEFFARIGAEIEEDRRTLEAIMARNGVTRQRGKHVAAWLAEKLGRLKFNGALVRRSSLTPLVELETLAIGVQGKLALWRSLRAAPPDPATAAQIDHLIERAERQFEEIERRRVEVARAALGP
jgi:hypothetical protein